MSSVTRLKQGMPSINGSLTDMLIGEQPLPLANVEPPRPPSVLERVKWSPVGLNFPDDLTADEWEEAAGLLNRFDGMIQLMIGDLINAAKDEWGWGDIYVKAMQAFPRYSAETLMNMASVAGKVQFSLRNENSESLDYAHIVAVSKLPPSDQRIWLQRAAAGKWTSAKLRQQISDSLKDKTTLELEKQKRQFTSVVNGAWHNVVSQYISGEGYSKLVISQMRHVLDLMENNASADEIVTALNHKYEDGNNA